MPTVRPRYAQAMVNQAIDTIRKISFLFSFLLFSAIKNSTIISINKKVVTRETISNIEAKLPQNEFIRTHRSYIVSIDKIASFTNETIEMENKKEIPISRSYKDEVLQKLENKNSF